MAFNLASYVMQQVGSGAGHPALCYRNETLSYAELFELASRIAVGLTEWGICQGQRILLPMLDTPAMLGCFLGCLRIGAVPVPLNPRLSATTFAYVLRDSAAAAVVCERDAYEMTLQVCAKCEPSSAPLLILQDLYSNRERPTQPGGLSLGQTLVLEPSAKTAEVGDKDDAFWQYTSGTTGEPKAVRHSARSMVESTQHYARGVLGISASDRIYSTAKLFFGYGLGNSVFFNLLNRAVALLDDRWPTPALVLENIRRFRPSVLFSVPALYSQLLAHGEDVKANMAEGARYCSAGSQLPAALFRQWRDRFDIEILDGIGTTEMGHIFMSNRPGRARAGSTGTAVDGYRVELRGPSGEPVADGQQGVLWVSGPSMSLGYHARPDSTQARFREAWYRTGDIFVADGHGGYGYVGREDDLFKVHGRWVAPAQIEQFVVSRFPQIQEAALVPYETADGLLKPMLFVVATDADGSLRRALTEAITASFESYKHPAVYRVVETLPKNDNGKLVRKQLIRSASDVAPRADHV